MTPLKTRLRLLTSLISLAALLVAATPASVSATTYDPLPIPASSIYVPPAPPTGPPPGAGAPTPTPHRSNSANVAPHVRPLSAAQIATAEARSKRSRLSIKDNADGYVSADFVSNGQAMGAYFFDARLPDGSAAVGFSFSPGTVKPRAARSVALTPVSSVYADSAPFYFLVCSYAIQKTNGDIFVSICQSDAQLIAGLIDFAGIMIGGAFTVAGYGFVGTFIAGVGTSIAFSLVWTAAHNPNGSVTFTIDHWACCDSGSSTSGYGYMTFGTGTWNWFDQRVTHSQCETYPSQLGAWYWGCGSSTYYKWAATDADASTLVALRSLDGSIQVTRRGQQGTTWTAFSSLGGSLSARPTLGHIGTAQRLGLFAFASNTLWSNYEPNDLGWSGWMSQSCCGVGVPSVIEDAYGTMTAAYLGTDGSVRLEPVNGAVTNLGGAFSSYPAIAVDTDQTLELFSIDANQHLWYLRQTSSGSWPATWTDLGCCVSGNPIVGRQGDGRLDVYARTTAGTVWHQWQTNAGSDSWSGWWPLGGGIANDLTLATNADGRIEVFGVDGNGHVQHDWETAANQPSAWSGWADLGCCVSGTPAVLTNYDGRLELFAVAGDGGQLFHQWQTVAGGGWSGWSAMGGAWYSP